MGKQKEGDALDPASLSLMKNHEDILDVSVINLQQHFGAFCFPWMVVTTM